MKKKSRRRIDGRAHDVQRIVEALREFSEHEWSLFTEAMRTETLNREVARGLRLERNHLFATHRASAAQKAN